VTAVIAHRGNSCAAPENTLAAIRSAILSGAEYIEIDIRRTRDGVLVLMHDATVDRTTNGTGVVSGLTWAEVRRLDAREGFDSETGNDPERVPTLADALALTVASSATLVIEVKSPVHSPRIANDLMGVVDAAAARRRVVVASFDHTWLREFAAHAPDVPIGELWIWPAPRLSRTRVPEVISVHWSSVLLNPTLIPRLRRAGSLIWVWTVDNPTLIRILRRLGADGITTSNPTRCRTVLHAGSSLQRN
jgi:glycerophosphoryl diester phosphodiesterase